MFQFHRVDGLIQKIFDTIKDHIYLEDFLLNPLLIFLSQIQTCVRACVHVYVRVCYVWLIRVASYKQEYYTQSPNQIVLSLEMKS